MTTDTQTSDLRMVRAVDGLDLALEPLQGLWSVEQYLKLSSQTNHLIEFTDGVIEVLPMPTRDHQVILAFLYEVLLLLLRPQGGKVLFAPLRVQVRPGKFREPDILVLQDAQDPRNQNDYWLGADLVVEIVSPDRPERDTDEKPRDYAEAGISEYWIVNPLNDTITVLVLEGEAYTEYGVFQRGGRATSRLLAGFSVSVDEVFDAQ
jgi:Uma2 family endonuclease